MPEQTPANDPNSSLVGFVAGTPILTPEDFKPIDQLRPWDVIQTQDDDQGDPEQSDHDSDDCDGDRPDHDPRWWEHN